VLALRPTLPPDFLRQPPGPSGRLPVPFGIRILGGAEGGSDLDCRYTGTVDRGNHHLQSHDGRCSGRNEGVEDGGPDRWDFRGRGRLRRDGVSPACDGGVLGSIAQDVNVPPQYSPASLMINAVIVPRQGFDLRAEEGDRDGIKVAAGTSRAESVAGSPIRGRTGHISTSSEKLMFIHARSVVGGSRPVGRRRS